MNTPPQKSRLGALGSKLKGAIGKVVQTEAALQRAAKEALSNELAASKLAPEVQVALHMSVTRVEQVKPRLAHAHAIADLTRAAFPKDAQRRNTQAGVFVEKHSSLAVARAILDNQTASAEGDEIVTHQPTMTGSPRMAWPNPTEVYARANRRGGSK